MDDPEVGSIWVRRQAGDLVEVTDVTSKRVVTRLRATGTIERWSFGEFEETFERLPPDWQPPGIGPEEP